MLVQASESAAVMKTIKVPKDLLMLKQQLPVRRKWTSILNSSADMFFRVLHILERRGDIAHPHPMCQPLLDMPRLSAETTQLFLSLTCYNLLNQQLLRQLPKHNHPMQFLWLVIIPQQQQ